jgi:hypothetical protein
MGRSTLAGTALRLLCLPVAATLLCSCDRQPPRVKTKPTEAQELHQDVEAVKNRSLDPNQAGPPLRFNPYPPSRGMSHDHGHRGAKH